MLNNQCADVIIRRHARRNGERKCLNDRRAKREVYEKE